MRGQWAGHAVAFRRTHEQSGAVKDTIQTGKRGQMNTRDKGEVRYQTNAESASHLLEVYERAKWHSMAGGLKRAFPWRVSLVFTSNATRILGALITLQFAFFPAVQTPDALVAIATLSFSIPRPFLSRKLFPFRRVFFSGDLTRLLCSFNFLSVFFGICYEYKRQKRDCRETERE